MSKLANGTVVKLVSNRGEEPVCPGCHHNNAVLHVQFHGPNVSQLECRDCHLIFIRVRYEDKTETTHVVARSLGKTCSNCQSFDINYHGRGGPVDPNSKPGYWCDECGTFWGN